MQTESSRPGRLNALAAALALTALATATAPADAAASKYQGASGRGTYVDESGFVSNTSNGVNFNLADGSNFGYVNCVLPTPNSTLVCAVPSPPLPTTEWHQQIPALPSAASGQAYTDWGVSRVRT